MTEPDGVVFVVDDDASFRESLKDLIQSIGLRVEGFASAEAFLRSKRLDVPGCLVLDVRLKGLTRISHNGIISRAASAENTFTSMIRGDQHYCHGDRQSIGRRWQRFGFARANARFAGVAIPSLPIRQITRR